jgi:hypothetical protein
VGVKCSNGEHGCVVMYMLCSFNPLLDTLLLFPLSATAVL